MKRLLGVLLLVSLAFGLSAVAQRRRAVRKPPPPPQAPRWFHDPLPGVTQEELARFHRGREVFDRFQRLEDGLGPVFNARGCSECHILPTIGGSGYFGTALFGATKNGAFDPMTEHGGPELQSAALGTREKSPHIFTPEKIPAAATIRVHRGTPPLFGLGLVDATPDATFIALAAQQAARRDGTAGRVAMVHNIRAGTKTVGRFGAKAHIPTLHQFTGLADRNELGMTSPEFPDENCPGGNCAELQFNPRPGLNDSGERVRQIVDFLTFLGAPPRGEITADSIRGEAIFARIGCESCHVSTLQTGDHPSPALHRVTYHPYSDFLLHDMGPSADGIAMGDAKRNEVRTTPLWGYRKNFSSTSLDAQIRAHDGQGRSARDRYIELTPEEKAQLEAFILSL